MWCVRARFPSVGYFLGVLGGADQIARLGLRVYFAFESTMQTRVEQTSLTLSGTLSLCIGVAALYVAHSRKVHVLCRRHLKRLRRGGGVAGPGAPTTYLEA